MRLEWRDASDGESAAACLDDAFYLEVKPKSSGDLFDVIAARPRKWRYTIATVEVWTLDHCEHCFRDDLLAEDVVSGERGWDSEEWLHAGKRQAEATLRELLMEWLTELDEDDEG